jgi:small subunit ribosomal protein S4e
VAKKGADVHLKRLASPAFWPIPKKEKVWTVRPIPGPHPGSRSIPLLIAVRDILKLAKTSREAEVILAEGKVKVDGKIRRDKGFHLGLMDLLEIPDIRKAYRVVPDPHKILRLQEIPEEEKAFKLCRIEDKVTVKGGHIQLALHDGRTLLVKVENPNNPEEDVYKVWDVLQLSLAKREILAHLKFGKGMYGLIVGGKNIGKHGVIAAVEKPSPTIPSMVKVKGSEGEFSSPAQYVMVVGEDKPLITLGGS